MTPEETKIARGFVACGRWRWLAGMLARPIGGGFPLRYNNPQRGHDLPDDSGVRYIPDITDPVTVNGGILHLVQVVWDDETITIVATREADGSRGWTLEAWDPRSPVNEIGPYSTKGELLLRALQAAPEDLKSPTEKAVLNTRRLVGKNQRQVKLESFDRVVLSDVEEVKAIRRRIEHEKIEAEETDNGE